MMIDRPRGEKKKTNEVSLITRLVHLNTQRRE